MNPVIPLLGGVEIPKTPQPECFEKRKLLAGVNFVTNWAYKTETEKEESNIHTYVYTHRYFTDRQ
jgi:hypothetical protein